MDGRVNNLGLDAVRAAAIVAVLLSHTADWFLGAGRSTDIHAAYVGGTGVEMFFSLSGFLIGGILRRGLERGFGAGALGRFWVRRWMRTLPAYWVLIGGMCWWFGTRDWRSPFFLQNFVPKTQWAPLTPQTWSLVLEEWFYLFVPPAILLAGLVLPRRWVIPVVCTVLVGLCTALRWRAYGHPDPAVWGEDLSLNPFLRLDCAAWGLLAAAMPRPGRRAAWGLFGAGCVLLAALGVVFELTFTPEVLAPWGYGRWALGWMVARTSLVEFAAMLGLVGLSVLLPDGRGPVAWGVRAVARLSYALYLVHVPVLYLGRLYGIDDQTGWAARGMISVIVVVAAIGMRVVVERPVLAVRDRVAPERSGGATGRVAGVG